MTIATSKSALLLNKIQLGLQLLAGSRHDGVHGFMKYWTNYLVAHGTEQPLGPGPVSLLIAAAT